MFDNILNNPLDVATTKVFSQLNELLLTTLILKNQAYKNKKDKNLVKKPKVNKCYLRNEKINLVPIRSMFLFVVFFHSTCNPRTRDVWIQIMQQMLLKNATIEQIFANKMTI